MKRDVVLIAALLIIAAFFAAAIWLMPLPAHASDRVYPYVGAVYRIEDGLHPRPWLEGGAAYSLGPIAPSLTLQVPVSGQFAPAVELRLRIKL